MKKKLKTIINLLFKKRPILEQLQVWTLVLALFSGVAGMISAIITTHWWEMVAWATTMIWIVTAVTYMRSNSKLWKLIDQRRTLINEILDHDIKLMEMYQQRLTPEVNDLLEFIHEKFVDKDRKLEKSEGEVTDVRRI